MRWLLVVALAGCGPSEVAPVSLGPDAAKLAVATRPFGLTLTRNGAVVARTAEPALEIGALDPFSARFYPDPLDDSNGVAYARSTDVRSAAPEGAGYRFVVATSDPRRSAAVTVQPEPDGSWAVAVAPDPADKVVHVRLNLAAAPGERYF